MAASLQSERYPLANYNQPTPRTQLDSTRVLKQPVSLAKDTEINIKTLQHHFTNSLRIICNLLARK